MRTDLGGGFKSIHFGHLQIHQYQVIFFNVEHFHGFAAIFGNINLGTPFIDIVNSYFLVDLIIFNQQYLHTGKYLALLIGIIRLYAFCPVNFAFKIGQFKGKNGANTLFAAYLYPAFLQFHQLFGYGKPQSRSAIFSGG